METNSAQAPTRNDVAAVHASMPGCGLAAYMTVLLVVMTFGGTMALMSGLTIVASSEAARPTRLMYGGDVEPYLYNGMRAAKLLGEFEVPDAFHAEDWTGMSACAVTRTDVLRLGTEGALTIPFAAITDIVPDADGVRVRGSWSAVPNDIVPSPSGPVSEVLCRFAPADGGDRFLSMVRAATGKSLAP